MAITTMHIFHAHKQDYLLCTIGFKIQGNKVSLEKQSLTALIPLGQY